jgi:hypothetical protein
VRQPRSSPTPGSSPNGRFVMKHGTDLAVSRVGESGRCCHLVQPWSQATCEISPLDRSLDQRRLSRARWLRFPLSSVTTWSCWKSWNWGTPKASGEPGAVQAATRRPPGSRPHPSHRGEPEQPGQRPAGARSRGQQRSVSVAHSALRQAPHLGERHPADPAGVACGLWHPSAHRELELDLIDGPGRVARTTSCQPRRRPSHSLMVGPSSRSSRGSASRFRK